MSLWREAASASLLSLLTHFQGFTAAGSSSHFITQTKDIFYFQKDQLLITAQCKSAWALPWRDWGQGAARWRRQDCVLGGKLPCKIGDEELGLLMVPAIQRQSWGSSVTPAWVRTEGTASSSALGPAQSVRIMAGRVCTQLRRFLFSVSTSTSHSAEAGFVSVRLQELCVQCLLSHIFF